MKTLDLTGCGSWEPGLDLTPCSGGGGSAVDCKDSVWGIDGLLYKEDGMWYNNCKAFYDGGTQPPTVDPLPPVPTPPTILNTKMELVFWSTMEPELQVDSIDVTMIDNGDGSWSYGQDANATSVKMKAGSTNNDNITAIVIPSYATTGSLSNAFSDLPKLEVFSANNGIAGTTIINGMLQNNPKLRNVVLGDVDHITHFHHLFAGDSALQIVPKMLTSSGQSFGSMFEGCGELLCIPALNTMSQTDTADMFTGTPKLQSPDAAAQTALLAGSDFTSTVCP